MLIFAHVHIHIWNGQNINIFVHRTSVCLAQRKNAHIPDTQFLHPQAGNNIDVTICIELARVHDINNPSHRHTYMHTYVIKTNKYTDVYLCIKLAHMHAINNQRHTHTHIQVRSYLTHTYKHRRIFRHGTGTFGNA